jgi:hypothetical protein
MSSSSVPVRIGIVRSLRRIGQAQPEYAFEKAKVFWEDADPIVISEVLELITGLPSRYFEQSLPLVRRALSRAKLQPPHFRIEVVKALALLERALPDYPDKVYEVTANYLRQYFGESDLMLYVGEYPLDQAFKLLCDYVLLRPQTNIHTIIKLLEERFKTYWSRYCKPNIVYDGLRHLSLIVGYVNYESPSLHEDEMVNACLITPFLEFANGNPEQAMELALSLGDNFNAFARRAALHVALRLSLQSDNRGDRLIEKAMDTWFSSHEYLSVFQTAESFLVPLAAGKASVAMHLLRKLSRFGVDYLESFEIAALLNLVEANEEARDLLQQILEKGNARLTPQVIKGIERLTQSHPEILEKLLHVAVERYRQDPPAEIASTATDAAAILARSSWDRAKPIFEMVIKSPRWIQASSIGQRLAGVAKANPDARTDVKHMLESLSHDSSPDVRQTTLMATVELRQLDGPFGLGLLEALSGDPDPAPKEDDRLLGKSIENMLIIQTVRGTVAWAVRCFVPVDKDRCWDLLVKLSADSSAYVRTMAVRGLERYSDPEHLEEVMSMLLSGGPKGEGLLRDESAWVRHSSLHLTFYQLHNNPKSIDALYSPIRNALGDTDVQIRSEAAERLLDAVAVSRNLRYQDLLQEVINAGATEERSTVAFHVRSYMDKDDKNAFEFFKPILTKLMSDSDRGVRERAAISLEKWAEVHPGDVVDWCCLLVKAEARSPADYFTGMIGYYISKAFQRLLPKHPAEAVEILECTEKLPDKFQLNEILAAARAIPAGFRPRVRQVAERLLKEGLPAAQQLLESWEELSA